MRVLTEFAWLIGLGSLSVLSVHDDETLGLLNVCNLLSDWATASSLWRVVYCFIDIWRN